MSKDEVKSFDDLLLPPNVVSKLDVSRLLSEMERVDEEITSAIVRARKHHERKLAHPPMSDQLLVFLQQNKIDIEESGERSELIKQLRLLKDKVPVVHMTFATTADRESLEKLTNWLRKSVHPQAVIEPGLQPSLVAGVYLRTPNHVHDFSLRSLVEGKHESLVQQLEALRGNK